MALFIKQDESRSKFQEQIAAELQAKARDRGVDADLPDGVEDSQYVKGTKQTTSLAWVWIVIIAAAVVSAIWLVLQVPANNG